MVTREDFLLYHATIRCCGTCHFLVKFLNAHNNMEERCYALPKIEKRSVEDKACIYWLDKRTDA